MLESLLMNEAAAERGPVASCDDFVYAPGCGAMVIRDFQNGIDTIDLRAFAFGDVETLLARADQCKCGVAIDLGRGDSLTIEDVHLAQLDASDFVL
jgi:hypothetical protein